METLKQRLKKKLREKNTLIKQAAHDIGVTKGHFEKVLDGERPPNENFINYASHILELDKKEVEEQFSLAQTQYLNSQLNAQKDTDGAGDNATLTPNRNQLAIIFLTGSIVVLFLLVFFSGSPETYAPPPEKLSTLYEGDDTTFIADITYPDGEQISTNRTFEKVWRIKNTGSVVWESRILKRETPRNKDVCDSINQVNIPRTEPGDTVDISVDFTSTATPGSCKVYWKMYDAAGKQTFPDAYPLYLLVNVVAAK